MSRFILATDDVAYEDHVRNAFPQVLNGNLRRVNSETWAHVESLDDLVGPPGSPTEVVAFGPGCSLSAALDAARRFDVERPDVSVLLVAPASAALLEQALRAGVREVLAPDASNTDVVAAFERASQLSQRRRASFGVPTEALPPTGQIITVISPKGGSGKTTTCTNLALGLANAAPGQVVLVDLDLQFGDVASALHLDPESTMVDVARAPRVDPATVKVALTSHASGLYVLAAPESPADAETISADVVAAALQILADQFRYVIVDTDAGLSEHALTAIEVATDLVCMCSMDVPSIRSLRKELLALDQLELTSARRHFLVNRADSRVGLDAADIEATVRLSIDVQVPSSRAIPLSLNQGSPVVESDPRSAVAKQFMALVNRFVDQPVAPRAGGFRRRAKDAR